ncbi:hypothetical protein DCC62_30600 [candidate division KSB1 bacterium]|nr:MAG: hypothetical protein DCC62_30600 [candidate division KSB1 bacterium]
MRLWGKITIATILVLLLSYYANEIIMLYWAGIPPDDPSIEWLFFNEAIAISLFLGVGVLIVVLLILWKMPIAQLSPLVGQLSPKEHAELENEYRKTLAQIIGGAIFLLSLFIAWKNIETTKESQFTDRYLRAIEQLRNENMEIRIGAIYALDRIAKESKDGYIAVIQVLSHYVRANSPYLPKGAENIPHNDSFTNRPNNLSKNDLPDDIQAIIAIIRTREPFRLTLERYFEIDLSNSNLQGANFIKANLAGINFSGSNLRGAIFIEANLHSTNFTDAVLANATIENTNAKNAIFMNADLRNASLFSTSVYGAKFAKKVEDQPDSVSYVQKANLTGAVLDDLPGFTKEHLKQIIFDERTFLPALVTE